MNRTVQDLIFFFLMAAGALAAALTAPSPIAYLCLLPLLPFGAILFRGRSWHGRVFYLVCSGELLVIACGVLSLWAGLFAAWMLAGVVLAELQMLEGRADLLKYFLLCLLMLVPAAVVLVANHTLEPILVFAAGLAAVLFLQGVRSYRMRKEFGAP
jgi:hypothetical protein